MDLRGSFLAICLLEALEDEDIRSFERILLQCKADPNQIALERGITPFHYSCGMDNLDKAEYCTKLILDNGGDPNVRSADKLTPLHIAAIFGRSKIVSMLLEKGGNIHICDNKNYTPFQYALYECQYDVIEVIQKFIFEIKIEEMQKKLENNSDSLPAISSQRMKNLTVQNIDDKKYTPNRINYNYDITSPYYINITHRRKLPLSGLLPLATPAVENEENNLNKTNSTNEQSFFTSTAINDSKNCRKNLVELTEANLSELSKNISPERSRISLIQSWREKVQRSKHRKSILGRFNDIDSLLSGIMSNDALDFTNTVLKMNGDINDDILTPKKAFADTAFGKLVEKLRKCTNDGALSDDSSFLTAEELANQSKLTESNFLRSPNPVEYIYQMSEQYEHIDHDEGIVFFEEKRLMNIPPSNLKAYQKQKQKELNQSQSSLSTDFTIPLDYDTEALRAELTQFGEPPGPITKSTKRLYTKRLIKFKRNPQKIERVITTNNNQYQNQIFSIELEKTIKNVEFFQRISKEYSHLENDMCEQFKNNHKLPDKKWREGNLKQSFLYLLIDPRISNNLPAESVLMEKHDIWKRFLKSIFYVGKGKSTRPFSHLYDAMKLHSKLYVPPQSTEINNRAEKNIKTIISTYQSSHKISHESSKLERILDIWKNEYGVICLHVFHNILPAEAYTREAAIIDALGLQHLTNLKRGDYYGPAKTWTMRSRKFLGIALLFKALQIYLAEGESQLFPSDLI